MSGHQPQSGFSAHAGPLPVYPLLVLKGAPLSTLIALYRYGAGNRRHLSARTGWKKAALDDALRLLQDMGLVARPRFRRWAITAAGQKLLQELLANPQTWAEETGPEEPENGSSATAKKPESPKSACSTGREKSERPENRSSATTPATETPNNSSPPMTMSNEGASNNSPQTTRVTESPKNRSSVAEEPQNGHSPHDHDHDNTVMHDHDDSTIHDHEQPEHTHAGERQDTPALLRRLAALHPPFDHAPRWLAGTSSGLVIAWLDYLDALPPAERRDRFRNEAGLLRRQVEAGRWPPSTSASAGTRGQPAAACPTCGQSHYLRDGVCWLCEGIANR